MFTDTCSHLGPVMTLEIQNVSRQVSEVKPVQFLDLVACGRADEDKQGVCNLRIN